MKDVTAIIKTFERPHIAQRLIDSIRVKYPTLPVLIADDSKEPTCFKGATTYHLPFDSGLSAGRNLLVKHVNTKYSLLLDDDWIFDSDTNIGNLVQILDFGDLDIIAGIIKNAQHFYGTLSRENDILYMKTKPLEKDSLYTLCDYTHNFFLALTETLLFNPWDNELKLSEHLDFFLRLKNKAKVAFTDKAMISEKQFKEGVYSEYRNRNFFRLAMKKNGIREFHNFKGEIYYFD